MSVALSSAKALRVTIDGRTVAVPAGTSVLDELAALAPISRRRPGRRWSTPCGSRRTTAPPCTCCTSSMRRGTGYATALRRPRPRRTTRSSIETGSSAAWKRSASRFTARWPSSRTEYAVFDFPGHGRGIAEFVRQVGGDLIVLGTRGRTNLRDLLFGSTAERVARDAPCSISAVKPEGFEHPLGR